MGLNLFKNKKLFVKKAKEETVRKILSDFVFDADVEVETIQKTLLFYVKSENSKIDNMEKILKLAFKSSFISFERKESGWNHSKLVGKIAVR